MYLTQKQMLITIILENRLDVNNTDYVFITYKETTLQNNKQLL